MFYAAHKHGVIDKNKNKKGQLNESGQKRNIMFMRMLILRTNMLIFFVIHINFHHFHFIVHTQNHMVSEGSLSITICDLIQN